MMIDAKQIPDEVVEALHTSLADDAGVLVPKGDCVAAIAAALTAWPGMEIETAFVEEGYLILPVPKDS